MVQITKININSSEYLETNKATFSIIFVKRKQNNLNKDKNLLKS